MFNKSFTFNPNLTADFIIKLFISLVLVCLISPLTWDISEEYDVMFGSLMVCLAPAVFGLRIGALTVFFYLLLGFLGAPVFAGHSGGMHYFISEEGFHPSTGFLFGYFVSALVIGFLAEKIKPEQSLKVIGLFLIGHIIILFLGFFHMSRIPDLPWDLTTSLKALAPSFLVKLGMFTLAISMLGRRIEE